MSREKSRKGISTELEAAVHFMKKGFYVAKSLDPQCPFDLVLTDKNGRCCLIDVKTKSIRKSDTYRCKKGDQINRSPSKRQKDMGIEIYIHEQEK